MKNKIINIKNISGEYEVIGSRAIGEIIRNKMKQELDNGNSVILNFKGVEQVTQGFIDEFIGILIRAFGIEYIKNKIEIINARQGIIDTINFVIKYSKERINK